MLRRLVNDVLRQNTARQQTSNHFYATISQSGEENRLVHIEKQFEAIPPPKRDKDSFMAAISMFKEKRGRGHVEFINSALKFVKEYGVHKDLDTYKSLLNVFPKGKMIPQSPFQKIFMHYPMQQNCCVKLLDEMEWNGVQPDKEIHDIVVNAFGEWNFATKKIKRMLYWMPKLKHSNKYLDRRSVEGKSLSQAELAGIALKMMSRDPATTVSLVKFTDTVNNEWLATAQCPLQASLLNSLENDEEVFVDASHVFVQEHLVPFIILSLPSKLPPTQEFKNNEMDEDFTKWFDEWETRRATAKRSIHEQDNETILALGALYQNDNATASRWIEQLQRTNQNLEKLRIRLRLDGRSFL